MSILLCIVIFCGFIILLNIFSTHYIQFLYRKLYTERRLELELVVNSDIIPDKWRKGGKRRCLKELDKLIKYVKQDRFFSQDEKENTVMTLDEMKEEWQTLEEDFFALPRSMK